MDSTKSWACLRREGRGELADEEDSAQDPRTGAAGLRIAFRIGGVGQKTIRSLSLIAELVYGARPSWRDPARFSFAHGGKDGHPYPVGRHNYDRSVALLEEAVRKARIGERERVEALRRLARFVGE